MTLGDVKFTLLPRLVKKLNGTFGFIKVEVANKRIDEFADIMGDLIYTIECRDRTINSLKNSYKNLCDNSYSKSIKSDAAEQEFDKNRRVIYAKTIVKEMKLMTTENVLNLVRQAYIDGFKKAS